MIGWFITATAAPCTDCRKRIPINARVRYPANEPDTVRLCETCGSIPRDLLEAIEMAA